MNAIIPFEQPLNVPAELAAQLRQHSSMGDFGEGGAGIRRVQLKAGSITALSETGEAIGTVQNADGSMTVFPQMANTADIVIVSQFPMGRTAYRQFYITDYAGKDSEGQAPACFSADGITPSANSQQPQSDKCDTCPRNVVGSSKTGKGKACHSRKRLAVFFANDPEQRIFVLDLPPTAIYGTSNREGENYFTLQKYANFLHNSKISWELVVTTIAFTELSPSGSPLLRFKPKGYLPPEVMNQVLTAAQDPAIQEMLNVDYKRKDEPQAALPNQAAPSNALPAPQPQAVTKEALLARADFPQPLRDWGTHPAVTVEMLIAEAAKWNFKI